MAVGADFRGLLEYLFPPEMVAAAFNDEPGAMQRLCVYAADRKSDLDALDVPERAYHCTQCREAITRPGLCPDCRAEVLA